MCTWELTGHPPAQRSQAQAWSDMRLLSQRPEVGPGTPETSLRPQPLRGSRALKADSPEIWCSGQHQAMSASRAL